MANTPTPFPPCATGYLILIGGIWLIAVCLRTPVTSVAPIVTQIRESFALSTAAAGALTTLPLLAFAQVSPLAAQLARRQGIEKALFATLAVMIAGALCCAPSTRLLVCVAMQSILDSPELFAKPKSDKIADDQLSFAMAVAAQ